MTKLVRRLHSRPPPVAEPTRPSVLREEAWAQFWAIIAPALVQAHQRGELPSSPQEMAAFLARRAQAERSRFDRLGYSSADVRAWLSSQGRFVNRVGRVSNDLCREYEEAMGLVETSHADPGSR